MPSVFKRIQQFNKGRIPEYTDMKLRFMTENPFRFFRGTCHLFYEDLRSAMDWKDSTKTWICGDLHLENFGSYKANNGIVYFDLNDFDEAILAPASWELSRLLTSIYVGAIPGAYSNKTADTLAKKAMDVYLDALLKGKAMSVEKQTASGLLKYFLEQVKQRKEDAFLKSRATITKKGGTLLIDHKKSFPVADELKASLIKAMSKWFRDNVPDKKIQIHDAVYRVAGTGSIGLHRYALLVSAGEKWHLLDLKQAGNSSLQPYVKIKQPVWHNQAERIVTLQDRIQQVTPKMLHAVHFNKTDFVLKALQPSQDRMDLSLCKGRLPELEEITGTMARLSASGQLRSSGRQGSSIADELIAFSASRKKWSGQVLEYAKQYAAKVVSDFSAYKEEYNWSQQEEAAVQKGRKAK